MSAYGGRRSGSGRKRIYSSKSEYNQLWRKGHHRIWLDNIIYSSWVSAKLKCGYNSDSNFGAHLLSLERRRRENDASTSCVTTFGRAEVANGPSAKRRRHFEGDPVSTSTPVKPRMIPLDLPNVHMESNDNASDSDVDVTGISQFSVSDSIYHVANDSVILKSDADKYSQDSDESMSEYDSPIADAVEENESVQTHVLEEALKDLNEDLQQGDDSDSFSDSSECDELERSLRVVEHESDTSSSDEDSVPTTSPVRCLQPQPSVPIATVSVRCSQSEPSVPSAVVSMENLQPHPSVPYVAVPGSSSQPQPDMPTAAVSVEHLQPHPSVPTVAVPSSSSQLQPSVPTVAVSGGYLEPHPSVPTVAVPESSSQPHASMPTVAVPGSSSQLQPSVPTTTVSISYPKLSRLEEQHLYPEELELVRETKFICSLDLVLGLFRKCQHPDCTNVATIKHHLVGPTLVVNWSCSSGHKGKFASSKDVEEMYANNLQVAASILLSGNNFAKIEKMANFLGLSFISDSTFYRMQRLYLIPCISEWWNWQREQLIHDFLEKEIVVCGDGQCDSPGHTAKNLCYFLMELVTGYILEVEVRDKRHVGLASSNMEKQALQIALQRLQQSLSVAELVTDASSSIKKLIADNFAAVFHSLDVWHKAKSIRKCLAKVGNLKNMDKIKAWSDHIILHFWHCANICKPSETTTDDEALQKMKSTWIGILHHVCDEHEWTGGKCGHGELEEHNLPWFDRRDKDFEALQKVILDAQLLESFKYYVRFRHTGRIECANSLSLMYTPKRCSYSYRAYKARKQLAAVDWNFHLTQEAATTKGGDLVLTRKYNQRTKEWNSVVVKVKKKYEYIPVLMAKVLRMRKEDVDVVTRNVSLNESDPALLAPTIAHKPAPPSKELYMAKKTRFKHTNQDGNLQRTSDLGDS